MRLDELLEFYSTNSLSWEQLEYDRGDFYNLHYGLIHVGLPTLVDSSKYNLPTIKEDFLPRNYELVKDGDVAFADASEDTNEVAKAIEFTNTDSNQIVCGLHTIHGRDKDDRTKIGFKGFYFSSPAFHNQVRRLAQGTKIFSISTKILSECFVSLPSKDEQTKIANLLSLIDERIALQSKLIDRLKSLMDGIIDKVTARTPNVSIGECLDCYSSNLQECETEEQGTYPVYGANGVCGYLDYATISAPAILIVKDGSGVGNVSYTNGNCSVVGTLNYLQPKKDVSAKFLYFVLKRFNFQPYKTGMAIPHIYFKAYSKARIFCPDYEEQTRMAESLSRIENKIVLEERLLCLLQEQKHYQLSAMFI